MSNRPKAVDFLNDEEEEGQIDNKTFSEEEPIYVPASENEEIKDEDKEFEGENESSSKEGNVETLPSGAISKGKN